MILLQKIKILSKLGDILNHIGLEKEWPGYESGINEEEYQTLNELVERVKVYNGWFTPESVRTSFLGIASWLTSEKLTEWRRKYPELKEKKRVAIIMAGNIPLVGFHDFLSVFLSGHHVIAKLSSDDKHLLPAILKILTLFDPEIANEFTVTDQRIENFDAVIATGSNNSANYFQTYFGKYPHIIRKNRTSVAFIEGNESQEELRELGKDIFTYFGMGCRNVSQIWIPEDFDLDRFFKGIFDFGGIANHNKYANNYDYNKALFLLNREELLDNAFILLRASEELNSPLGMLHYRRYSKKEEFEKFITDNQEEIQVVVGKKYVPFGIAQSPALEDYADGVDTMSFLTNL